MISFNLVEFSRLYSAFVEYCGMESHDAMELAYTLNTAHIDTLRSIGRRTVNECPRPAFASIVAKRNIPYANLLTFYESMDLLDDSILSRFLTERQRRAQQRLWATMRDVRCMFTRLYGFELDDAMIACDILKRTAFVG